MRERNRRLLKDVLGRLVEECESECQALGQESLEGPSPWERAVEIMPDPASALLTRRLQDANFREVRRLTNLLRKTQPWEQHGEETTDLRLTQDITENRTS